MIKKPKLIVIVGPTASGKSDLAIKLAKKFGGEVISADSRQIYKGLDIATNKVTPKEAREVPHHLIDVASPKKRFNVSDFKKLTDKKILEIASRGNLPILVGGTGFYIEAVVDGILPPEVPPDEDLRNKLSKKTLKELQATLKTLDQERFSTVQKENPRRLIRAIEIATAMGKVPSRKKKNSYNSLMIGLQLSKEALKINIEKSVKKRMERGMVAEALKLHEKGLSWKRMRELGLEYRLLADYHQGKIRDKKELEDSIIQEDWKYAKRQITWFKRDKRIEWFSPGEVADIEKKVRQFLGE